MGRRSESTTSIRRRLLILLLPPLLALMIAAGFANSRAAKVVVETARDQRLGETARSLAFQHATQPAGSPASRSVARPILPGKGRFGPLRYAIRDASGRLVGGDPQLVAVRTETNPSYADVPVEGHVLRIATYRSGVPNGRVVSVAEPEEREAASGNFILVSSWLVAFIQVDVTLLLVWVAVHFGLQPLLALRREIEARSPRELQPILAASVPFEVRPLVEGLNLLFDLLREAARSQRAFVADTAHQLRTPITGLLGHLELLMRDPGAVALRGQLAQLHAGMIRLARSANQLLSLARADPSANLAERPETVELQAIVARIVEHNVNRAADSGHDLGADAREISVMGRARLLEDLLGNLLDNALTYTPAGSRINVRCGVTGGRGFLEVEDDGPGIPQSERTHVRQRFYRLPGSVGHGSGLGLAIVEEIAKLHGASLLIEGGPGGRGTRVRVLFPPGGARRL
ncbi:MAG: ATP-binding protein [Steroidobacteraceae bacterium]